MLIDRSDLQDLRDELRRDMHKQIGELRAQIEELEKSVAYIDAREKMILEGEL